MGRFDAIRLRLVLEKKVPGTPEYAETNKELEAAIAQDLVDRAAEQATDDLANAAKVEKKAVKAMELAKQEADQAILDLIAAANNLRVVLVSTVSPKLSHGYIENRVRRAFPGAFNN